MHQKLCVGEITNTHGIRGEVKVIPLTDDISAFDNIKKVSIDNKEYEIESYREHKSVLLVKFRGYDDINLVERLKGKFLEVDRDELSRFVKIAALFARESNRAITCEADAEKGIFSVSSI